MLYRFLDRLCAIPYSKCNNLLPPFNLFFSLLVLLLHNNSINATIVGVFCSDFIIEARYYLVCWILLAVDLVRNESRDQIHLIYSAEQYSEN